MNLPIRKLPKSVQTLICASNQINCYKKAVQELVFNALDADATSIAVRIHIAEGSIQVVDNGCGISKADLKYIGQNYMTSKLADISTLRSAPNKYGFKGQSLANLAQISENLRITSRFNKSDITWVKIFENGAAKTITKCSPRPSKGTTIEIKGILYNLTIQKKSIDVINELQCVKTILEHISVVHSNISLSLRDDSKNEIVYKIHKNRDMYQTLSTLYEIEKTNVQELQVEKNQYKLKAFVGRNVDITRQFIFLNGKFIDDSSNLYKRVNDNFKKYLRQGKHKMKKNVYNDEENHIFQNEVPFYFIFITCPYIDYELTNTVLEFKDWGQINSIFDKFVKFFIGDAKLQEVPKQSITKIDDRHETESTKNEIRKIIQKVLGSHSKKPEISLMQKGVKGKLIKRKTKTNKYVAKLICSNKFDNNQTMELCASLNQNENLNKNATNLKKQPKLRHFTNSKEQSPVSTKKLCKPNVKSISKIRTHKQLSQNNRKIKQNDKKCSKKKLSLNSKFAMETESVKKRCELFAQKTKELMKHNINYPKVHVNENNEYNCSNFVTGNKKVNIKTKVKEFVIREYIPLQQKPNYGFQVERIIQNKNYKSNYDLLKTIIHTQCEPKQWKNVQDRIVSDVAIPDSDFELLKIHKSMNPKRILNDRSRLPIVRDINNHDLFQEESSDPNVTHINRNESPLCYESSLQVLMSDNHSNLHQADIMQDVNMSLNPSVRKQDRVSLCCSDAVNSNLRPYLMRASDDVPTFQVATYQSHNYIEQDFDSENNAELYKFYKKPRNFITTQSRQNFMISKNNRFKSNKRNLYATIFKTNNKNRKLNKSKKFDMEKNTVQGFEEPYTIEFTESDKCFSNSSKRKVCSKSIDAMTESMNYIFSESRQESVPTKDTSWLITNNIDNNTDLDYEPFNRRNTYTISNPHSDNHLQPSLDKKDKNYETYTIDSSDECCFKRGDSEKQNILHSNDKSDTDILFVSKLQGKDNEQIENPIDVCETVLESHGLSTDGIREFDSSFRFIQDPCENLNLNDDDDVNANDLPNELNHNINDENQLIKNSLAKPQNQELENTSHHFTTLKSNILLSLSPKNIQNHGSIPTARQSQKTNEPHQSAGCYDENEKNVERAFSIRNRMCFVPKGMSPIFIECHTKLDREYSQNEDCYADKMYNDFMDKVEKNTEIFKPRFQDSGDVTAKTIKKVNDKLNKDSASLKFDGTCIGNAKVLGQVDCKFIAAIMKSKDRGSNNSEEFLVLFDQHAVHERIRLENNLADYLTGSLWKSVAIDAVSLKMSRDEILYLHNYKDKFTQFGLQWNILNYKDVSITAIPEGILGKNPRQVEKIIKAVKNLIREEISIIQMQKGCVSQYPKSLMDLIFSEACRYAIKFGDHLSKSQCIELLNDLSGCKTPFQCAHGRPSMAVIMSIGRHQASYKINFKNLKRFIKI